MLKVVMLIVIMLSVVTSSLLPCFTRNRESLLVANFCAMSMAKTLQQGTLSEAEGLVQMTSNH